MMGGGSSDISEGIHSLINLATKLRNETLVEEQAQEELKKKEADLIIATHPLFTNFPVAV